ncbi:MAG: DUF2007 domain-containing protein [Cellvibrionaceae bacterium]
MQKVYTDQTLLMVTHIQNLLNTAHIKSVLRNEYAAGGVGELSFVDSWPELWVEYEDVAQAKKVIADFLTSSEEQEWVCQCGETNGAAFASCWSCRSDRTL